VSEETSRFHERVSELLADALELPDAERVAHVRAAAKGDAELEREVLSLLGWTGDDELAVQAPAPEPPPGAAANAVPGYRVIRVIGEGGMGTVYEAEQLEPSRRVALKVVRGLSTSPESLRRFRREADLLARLQHPGICQVYEVGRTTGGIPFLSMELIDGRPLTRFADEEGLDRAERLALMCRVCEAVAHAHERGIVHRDLKPENVLVTPEGRPKILDFGIARVTQPDKASTLLTGTGSILGTISYMSPEQAAGKRGVDHRADVFSLGVMGFELLTGRLPMDLRELSFPQALYQIQQADLSLAGRSEPSLRGDLETILGKALEREPDRRYPSAEAMAADIRRHLEHEPIVARRPSLAYRARKFTRRHRLMVAMVSLLVATLTLASSVSLHQARLAKRRAAEAEWQSYRAVVTAADAAINAGDVPRAAELLEGVRPALASWEARHLEAVLAEGLGALVTAEPAWDVQAAPEDSSAFAALGPRSAPDLVALDLPDFAERGRWPLGAEPLVVPREAFPLAVRARLTAGPLPESLAVLDAASGDELAVLRACELARPLQVADVSADGFLVIAPSPAGSDRVCDLRSGEWTAAELGRYRTRAAFSPDERHVALASAGNTTVHELRTGAEIWRVPAEGDSGSSVAYSRDGHFLYAAGMGAHPFVDRWDLSTGSLAGRLRVGGGTPGDPWGLDPDGSRLAWVADTRILILDASLEGEPLRRWAPRSGLRALAFADDGHRLLAAAGEDGLRAWTLVAPPARALWKAHDSYAYDVAFSPDGRLLASGGWDGRVRIWDAESHELRAELRVPNDEHVVSLAFSPDSERLAVATGGGLHVAEIASGAVLRSRSELPAAETLRTRPGRGELLLTARTGGLLVLSEATLETRAELDGEERGAWSPDGWRLATSDSEGRLSVLDAESLAPVWTADPAATGGGVGLPTWSPSGRLLAAVGRGGVLVLDAATGRELRRLSQPTRRLRPWCMAWSHDERRLVTGSDDGRVRIWDAATGDALLVLQGHASYVRSIAFDPSGRRLASASGDGQVGLWSAVSEPLAAGRGRD
jgi:WD40 repeat protein/predicted Ser/Thr protein kinase